MQHIGLDFETYGDVDLTKHGLERYINGEHFRPLIAHTYTGNGALYYEGAVDFVEDFDKAKRDLTALLDDRIIVAHNAGFEKAVLDWLGIDIPLERFVDSAMVARAAGAAGKLEAAAPQLLGVDKMAEGWPLIKHFSIPGPYQEAAGNLAFDPQIVADHPDKWLTFKEYCALDARLSYGIVKQYPTAVTHIEHRFNAITMEMNMTGWPVDIEMVEEMNRRFLINQAQALHDFGFMHDIKIVNGETPPEVMKSYQDQGIQTLNLGSTPQLVAWCKERGVRTSSFDEQHVEKLRLRLEKKLEDTTLDKVKRENYEAVHSLVVTKQILGGAALKKLPVILATTSADGRLRDQYLHYGAGQTGRTTGRSVQMQNLKQIGETPDEMLDLFEPGTDWDNDKLARNIRQVFTSSHVDGSLLVGDFKGVESRGLAWAAGAEWKLNAFRAGKDMYKVLAEKMFNVHYDDVLKPQRTGGKVGELSCGYGAGAAAVQKFAAKMNIEMTEGEAAKLVSDWRNTNPEVVQFWAELDRMLHQVVEGASAQEYHNLPDFFRLYIERITTPESLRLQAGNRVQSVQLRVEGPDGNTFLKRVFHGCYASGRNIRYYKPSDRKTGDLWKANYRDPKTGHTIWYELYGGKLTGIFIQSFCRELFFQCLVNVHAWVQQEENVELIGQFHDEIDLDWWPTATGITRVQAMNKLGALMSGPGMAKSFPLDADIKFDYRYTK